MKPTEAVPNIVHSLNDRLSVSVKISGLEGERPVPVVLVEDWEINDLQHHNTQKVGGTLNIDVDDDGQTEYAS